MRSSKAAMLQSANLFVFVINNSIRFTGPSGMHAVTRTASDGEGRSIAAPHVSTTTAALVIGVGALVGTIGRATVDGVAASGLVNVVGNVNNNTGFSDTLTSSSDVMSPYR